MSANFSLAVSLTPVTSPRDVILSSVPLCRAAMFWLNLSFSILISRSFFFIAPGLFLKLLYLILPGPVHNSSAGVVGISGRAFAKDSRSVISFLDGRLRFFDGAVDFSIREISAERLVKRLSFFRLPKTLCGRLRKFPNDVVCFVPDVDVCLPTVGA